jgi:hypothetical protein
MKYSDKKLKRVTGLVRFINEFKIVIQLQMGILGILSLFFVIYIEIVLLFQLGKLLHGMWMLGYHLSQIMRGSHASPIYLFTNFLN